MANASPSRLGQVQGAGADDALFLTQFSGQVLTAFETKTIMDGRVESRTISNGQSAQFPAIWRAAADYHVPGAEILGQTIEHNEVIITVDGILKSDAFVAEIDELKNHYEVRSHYAKELGYALARTFDANITRSILQSAGSGSLFSADQGGGSVINPAFASDGNALAAGIYSGIETFEGKDVPTDSLTALYLPAQYYLLMQSEKVGNRDFGRGRDYATQDKPMVGDVEIIRSNNTPLGTSETSDANVLDKYQGNWTNFVGCMFHKSAAGVVKLKNVTTEVTRDPRRLGTLMVSSMAAGHGSLRSKAALGLRTA